MDIQVKLKEAQAYRKHGLYSEALGLFEELLPLTPESDEDLHTEISGEIAELKEILVDIEKSDDVTLSEEDASILTSSWEAGDTAGEILSSAASFSELGLHKEAVAEYAKLFATDSPTDAILPTMLDSLFALHSPSRVIDQIEKLIQENSIPGDVAAAIKFAAGQELEQRNHKDLALELYESVKDISPDFPDIDKHIQEAFSTGKFDSRYDYLIKSKHVDTNKLQNALGIAKKSNRSVEAVLIDTFSVNKQEIGKSLSLYYRCPFREYKEDLEVPYELIRKLKKAFLVQNCWVPLAWELNSVDVLIDDPSDLLKTDPIPGLLNAKKINYMVGIREDIEKIIRGFYDEKKDSGDAAGDDVDEDFDMMPDIDFEEEEDDEIEDGYEDVDESSGKIVRMVDQILINAYRKNCSDIHIEPSVVTKKTSIRYRIDGVCQEVLQVPNTNARAIMSRLKIMSGLDIAERRLPQDGKIKFKRKGIKGFELRLATLPTAGGYEDAVLRILAESGAMKLDDMGLNERNNTVMKKIIQQPYGLVLVVGPTGSGKTTTLHACLGHINKPGIKIWTAEDPVEITQQGLRQVEAKPKIGLDFARIMRAFLRADPDVIMIGEMRDEETASIGVEASLTGHLVFSTLHTNSAPETVTRLLDMGLNPLNFSDAFLGVLAQRLVRRLCKSCKKTFHPSEEDFADYIKDYGEEEALAAAGVTYTEDLEVNKIVGCEECNNTGYRGRLGVHELMEGTKELKRMIKREAPTDELFAQAASEGMRTIKQDGVIKMFEGLTDIYEIRRVCVT
jgi:type II secretory ATPase GspE/PulE/Tfp pilus assembly ATPase PilB-like protein